MATEEKKLPKTVKINASNCSSYTAIHHVQFHRNQIDLVKGADKTKLKIPEVAMEKWDSEVNEEVDLNETVAKSVHTKALLEKDAERDRLLTHLFGIIRFHRYSPTRATAAAAEKMEAIFGKYIAENIREEGFEDESGHIVGLLKDAAPYTAEITTLGLTDTLSELKTVNEAYEALSKERRSDTVVSKRDAIRAVRPKTDESYDFVCRYIEAAYLFATSDDERTLIEDLVKKMNRVVFDFKRSHKESLAQKRAAKQPKDPKQPKYPKDPKPDKPKPDDKPDIKLPEEGPKKPDPKKPEEGGGPDIHLPEE